LLFGFDVPFERLRQLAITVLLGVGFGMLLSFIPLAAPPALRRYQPCLSSSLPE